MKTGPNSTVYKVRDKPHRKSPYCADFTDPRTGKHDRQFFSRQDAARKHNEEKEDRLRSGLVMSKSMTVEAYLKVWLKDEIYGPGSHLAKSSRDGYRNDTEWILKSFRNLPLQDLDYSLILGFLNELPGKNLMTDSIKHIKITLHKALQHAVHPARLLASNPMAGLKWKPRNPTRREYDIKCLNEDQLRTYLAKLAVYETGAYNGPEDARDMLAVQVALGLRLGEVRGLSWGHLNLAFGQPQSGGGPMMIGVEYQVQEDWGNDPPWYLSPPKYDSRRTLPVLDQTVRDILKRRREQGRRLRRPLVIEGSSRTLDDLVFINRSGEPVDSRYLRRESKLVLAQAGLPYINDHKLRSTFSTLVLARLGQKADSDDWRVKRYLGHRLTGITHTAYNHAEDPLCLPARVMADILAGRASNFGTSATASPSDALDLSDLTLETLDAEPQ